MATVESVNGPVELDELGLTLIHEHFRSTDEALRFQFPHLYDEEAEWEAAMSDARAVKGHGVKTVVEPSAMFLPATPRSASGWRTRAASRYARHGRLHLRAPAAAAAQPHRGPDRRDLRPRDRERHPGDRDQAGVHQVRGRRAGHQPERREDPPGRGPCVAADRAADHGPLAPGLGDRPRADAVFTEEGVDPGKVQIAHTGDTENLEYIEKLLDTGCWIGLDRYGLDIFLPTERRNATTLALLERGYVERMFLSQDFCSTLDWFTPRSRRDPAGERGAELEHDLPVRAGDPHAQGGRDDRRAARAR